MIEDKLVTEMTRNVALAIEEMAACDLFFPRSTEVTPQPDAGIIYVDVDGVGYRLKVIRDNA